MARPNDDVMLASSGTPVLRRLRCIGAAVDRRRVHSNHSLASSSTHVARHALASMRSGADQDEQHETNETTIISRLRAEIAALKAAGGAGGLGLEGKLVVVTGGAMGIGRAICVEFARAGAEVLCCDVAEPEGRETEAMGAEQPGRIKFQRGDLSDSTGAN